MRSSQQTTEIAGLTFTRYHYTANTRRGRMEAEAANLGSAWTLQMNVAEITEDLKPTGEWINLAVKIWPVQEIIKVEGADRLCSRDAARLAKALAAATELLGDFTDETRCRAHGSVAGPMGPDCDGCAEEEDARIAAQAEGRE